MHTYIIFFIFFIFKYENHIKCDENILKDDILVSHSDKYAYNDWCLNCTDKLLCSNKFLFIITIGRSGSTSLLNMVNSISGIYLGGEIGDILYSLINIYNVVQKLPQKENKKYQSIGSWQHVSIKKSDLYYHLQEIVKCINPPPINGVENTVIRGFKELRWDGENLHIIKKIFPCSRIIFNYRKNHQLQYKSLSNKKGFEYYGDMLNINDTIDIIIKKESMILKNLGDIGLPYYLMALEDFGIDKFNNLALWLGADCKYNKTNHSNNKGYNIGEDVKCE